jgi:site-specific DNA recombinase
MGNLAAIYARLSKDDKQQTSIPRQIGLCRTASAKHRYEGPEHLVFIDDGISGTILERPGLERLLALVRTRQIRAVFVSDGDRLSREPAHDWMIREELKLNDVTLYVNGTPIDTSPEGETKDSMLAVFAKYERLKTAQRMRAGKLHRARSRPLASYVALGYQYVPDAPGCPAHYEVIPEEAQLVQRIFLMYLSGLGTWKIANTLTSERVLTKMDRLSTRTVKKQRPPGVWSKSFVHKILRNQAYTGTMYWNKDEAIEPNPKHRRKPRNLKSPKTAKRRRDQSEWLPIAIPQIIDPDTFARAQAQITKNSAANKRSRKHEYLFLRGRLRCGDCGFPMGGFMSRGKSRRYECQSHNDHLGIRCRKSVSADAIEEAIWEVIEDSVLTEPSSLARYIDLKQRDAHQRQAEVSHVRHPLAQVRTELQAIDAKQQKLLNLHLNDYIDQAMFSANKTTLDHERDSLVALRSELEARLNAESLQQSQVRVAITYLERVVEKLPRASIAERRLVIESLDVHVVYRDMEHMRMFFDLPLTDDQDEQFLQEFRWKGIESLQAIDWDNLSVTSSG